MNQPAITAPGQADPAVSRLRLIRLGSVLGVPVYITPSWLLIVGVRDDQLRRLSREQMRVVHSELLPAGAAVRGRPGCLGAAARDRPHRGEPAGRPAGPADRGLPARRGVRDRGRGSPAARRGCDRAPARWSRCCWRSVVGDSAGCRRPASAADVLLELLAWSNLVIAVFNALPGLPLDGGRVVQALIWKVTRSRLTGVRIAAWSGRVLAALLAVLVLIGNAAVSQRHTPVPAPDRDRARVRGGRLPLVRCQPDLAGGRARCPDGRPAAGPADPAVGLPAGRHAGVRSGAPGRPARAAGIVVVDEPAAAGPSLASRIATMEPRRRPWVTLARCPGRWSRA